MKRNEVDQIALDENKVLTVYENPTKSKEIG